MTQIPQNGPKKQLKPQQFQGGGGHEQLKPVAIAHSWKMQNRALVLKFISIDIQDLEKWKKWYNGLQ